MGGLTGQLVFGYASLVTDGAGPPLRPAFLRDHRRVWGVATDNEAAIPGYKLYLSRADGGRPAVFVAFLDVEQAPGSRVNGLVRQVDEADLPGLDARERNYDRIDVTGLVEGVGAERVWTYRGSAAGRERLRRGRAEGRAVVSRDYLEKVRRGFAGLGPEAERAFEASTAPLDLAVADLERIDLPADPAATGAGA